MARRSDEQASDLRSRLLAMWRRTLSISWPVMVQQLFQTLMRTTDIIIVGLFSPAAVAAVGLADLYAEVSLRLAQGLGGGAIALSSQDTGSGATANRDEAITQALLLGFVAGFPLVVFGLLFGRTAIALLGAPPEVARLGGIYLGVIFAASPMRHVAHIGVNALQGTGDTRTPMLINIAANAINIVGSAVLGLGIGPAPELSILGVGLATATANTFNAVVTLLAIRSPLTPPSFARPSNPEITRQLIAVGTPKFAEGLSATVAAFPFNAILLTFGTDVNAAYHIARRMYQQITGPLYRSFSVSSSIVVGQTLGEGDPEGARFAGWAITALGVVTLGLAGAVLFVGAVPLARVFTRDAATIRHAADFARVFGVVMVAFGVFFPLAGSLRGAGDTLTPFYARLTGMFGMMLGFSYLAAIVWDYGLAGVYAGLGLNYVWWALVVVAGFLRGGWADRAASMMAEREEVGLGDHQS